MYTLNVCGHAPNTSWSLQSVQMCAAEADVQPERRESSVLPSSVLTGGIDLPSTPIWSKHCVWGRGNLPPPAFMILSCVHLTPSVINNAAVMLLYDLVPSPGPLTWSPHLVPSPGPLTWSPHLGPSPGPLTWSPHLVPSPGPLTWSPHLVPSPSPLTWSPHCVQPQLTWSPPWRSAGTDESWKYPHVIWPNIWILAIFQSPADDYFKIFPCWKLL